MRSLSDTVRGVDVVRDGVVLRTVQVYHAGGAGGEGEIPDGATGSIEVAQVWCAGNWPKSCEDVGGGGQDVGEHRPVRDSALVDAVQVHAVLRGHLGHCGKLKNCWIFCLFYEREGVGYVVIAGSPLTGGEGVAGGTRVIAHLERIGMRKRGKQRKKRMK